MLEVLGDCSDSAVSEREVVLLGAAFVSVAGNEHVCIFLGHDSLGSQHLLNRRQLGQIRP